MTDNQMLGRKWEKLGKSFPGIENSKSRGSETQSLVDLRNRGGHLDCTAGSEGCGGRGIGARSVGSRPPCGQTTMFGFYQKGNREPSRVFQLGGGGRILLVLRSILLPGEGWIH